MAGRLKEYQQKRHFDKTGEPSGEVAKKQSKRLRFVVQHHIASRDHYDFRLEWDGVLKSWAVPKGPSYSNRDKRLAVQVEDHPLDYRSFEGTIPKGQYGGGVVMVWDEGDWHPIGDAGEGLASGTLKFSLNGDRLKGKWALVRMKPKPGERGNNWLLLKEKDDYENAYDIHQFTTSVKTGRTMHEIEEGAPSKMSDSSKPKKPASPSREGKKPASRGRKRALTAEAIPEDIPLTHPEKILFPASGITKGEAAGYYLKVAERMMPYVENRVLSVVRCPDGIEGSCFFKKHPVNDNRGVVAISVPTSDGEQEEYYYITDIHGLLFEVQMNSLEFHPWGSRVETLEHPDIMVFDLDPDEGMELERIRQGVRDLKSLLDQLSLVSYLKTSGGKGYHIVIPFKPVASWDSFHTFSQNIAKTMEAKWPDRYTSNVRKAQRNNRIFVDWIRNGRGATSVAPYSIRAREGAPVSMPISWKELDTVAPNGIAMQDALDRLKRKDPWEGFFANTQQLK